MSVEIPSPPCSRFLLFIPLAAALWSCATPEPTRTDPPHAAAPEAPGRVRNVILMIGDGMGPQQLGLLFEYAHRAPASIYKDRPVALEQVMDDGRVGLSRHGPAQHLVVDSACSATQLAIGQEALPEMIGLNADGDPVETILEKAKRAGKATGLVSDTRLTHATPAAFAAHQPYRNLENAIAVDMLATAPDVMLSGGLRHWVPGSAAREGSPAHEKLSALVGDALRVTSRREDERDLLAEARAAGYEVVFERSALAQVEGGRVLGLFAHSGMMDGLRNTRAKADPERTEPSLAEMTDQALDILSRDEDGFFLMVEGGQIDWAGHNNDVGLLLHEMIKFDDAVRVVHAWARGREDTLVIITADHETGGLGLSYSGASLPEPRPLPGAAFKERPYKANYNYGALSTLDRLYNQQKPLQKIVEEHGASDDRSPEALARRVREYTGFSLSVDGARAVLASEPNPYLTPGHPYLHAETVPRVDDLEAFFIFAEEVRGNLLARQLAAQQNVVWSTATHTHTPVAVITLGPPAATRPFGGLLHHTELGRLMERALLGP